MLILAQLGFLPQFFADLRNGVDAAPCALSNLVIRQLRVLAQNLFCVRSTKGDRFLCHHPVH